MFPCHASSLISSSLHLSLALRCTRVRTLCPSIKPWEDAPHTIPSDYRQPPVIHHLPFIHPSHPSIHSSIHISFHPSNHPANTDWPEAARPVVQKQAGHCLIMGRGQLGSAGALESWGLEDQDGGGVGREGWGVREGQGPLHSPFFPEAGYFLAVLALRCSRGLHQPYPTLQQGFTGRHFPRPHRPLWGWRCSNPSSPLPSPGAGPSG